VDFRTTTFPKPGALFAPVIEDHYRDAAYGIDEAKSASGSMLKIG
jgi:hypothetical protein